MEKTNILPEIEYFGISNKLPAGGMLCPIELFKYAAIMLALRGERRLIRSPHMCRVQREGNIVWSGGHMLR